MKGGGQRSRPLPLPPLTDLTTPCLPFPLSEQLALRARKILLFSLPRFLFTLFPSLSLILPLLPRLTPPHPPLTDLTAPCLPLPLSEQLALRARKILLFSLPRFLFTLFSSLSLILSLLPRLTPPHPPYLLPRPPPHL